MEAEGSKGVGGALQAAASRSALPVLPAAITQAPALGTDTWHDSPGLIGTYKCVRKVGACSVQACPGGEFTGETLYPPVHPDLSWGSHRPGLLRAVLPPSGVMLSLQPTAGLEAGVHLSTLGWGVTHISISWREWAQPWPGSLVVGAVTQEVVALESQALLRTLQRF